MACHHRRARAALPYVRVDVAADQTCLLGQLPARSRLAQVIPPRARAKGQGITWVQPAGKLRLQPAQWSLSPAE
jgi:hypothetical protein